MPKPSDPQKLRDYVEIIDEGSLDRYRTEVPYTLVHGQLGRRLSLHARWLHVYLRSVAGVGGIYREDTATLARGSGLSRTKVETAKQELVGVGLITVDDAGVHIYEAGNTHEQ
jgi:hypothetical protein